MRDYMEISWKNPGKDTGVGCNFLLELLPQIVVLEKTPESPLGIKEFKPVHPKGDQAWIVIGRTDAEAPILCPPDAKSWLIGKDRYSGKDWGQQEKSMTEDEMVGWHRWLNGQEFEHTPGVDEGQGCLLCCSPWGHKESDLGTEQYKVAKICTYIFLRLLWF